MVLYANSANAEFLTPLTALDIKNGAQESRSYSFRGSMLGAMVCRRALSGAEIS